MLLLCTTFGVNCTVGFHLPNKIYGSLREPGSLPPKKLQQFAEVQWNHGEKKKLKFLFQHLIHSCLGRGAAPFHPSTFYHKIAMSYFSLLKPYLQLMLWRKNYGTDRCRDPRHNTVPKTVTKLTYMLPSQPRMSYDCSHEYSQCSWKQLYWFYWYGVGSELLILT